VTQKERRREIIAAIHALWSRDDLTNADIAEEAGCHPNSLPEIARREGLPPRLNSPYYQRANTGMPIADPTKQEIEERAAEQRLKWDRDRLLDRQPVHSCYDF
jgi:hypothetical protein